MDALQNQQSPCAPAILSERSTPLLLLLLPWPPNWQTRVSSISSVDGNYRRLCSNTLVLYWSLSTGAATEPAAPSATIKLTEGGEDKKARDSVGMVQVYFETAGRMVSESLHPCNNVFPLLKHVTHGAPHFVGIRFRWRYWFGFYLQIVLKCQ